MSVSLKAAACLGILGWASQCFAAGAGSGCGKSSLAEVCLTSKAKSWVEVNAWTNGATGEFKLVNCRTKVASASCKTIVDTPIDENGVFNRYPPGPYPYYLASVKIGKQVLNSPWVTLH